MTRRHNIGEQRLEWRPLNIDPYVGRLLKSIEAGTAPALSADDVEVLMEAGLTVPLTGKV